MIPRVRQRLRLLVLADTADKRVAEVWDQMKGLGGWLRVCMFCFLFKEILRMCMIIFFLYIQSTIYVEIDVLYLPIIESVVFFV